MITLEEIKKNESIRALVKAGNRYLEALGYTDHGPRHLSYVSRTASYILKALGYSEREIELAAIAGWVHDVGNSINRHDHGPNGAVMLFPILKDAGMSITDTVDIITAVTEEYHLQLAANAGPGTVIPPRPPALRRKRTGGRHEGRSTGHRAA